MIQVQPKAEQTFVRPVDSPRNNKIIVEYPETMSAFGRKY